MQNEPIQMSSNGINNAVIEHLQNQERWVVQEDTRAHIASGTGSNLHSSGIQALAGLDGLALDENETI